MKYRLIPIVESFIADSDTPVTIFLKLRTYFRIPFLFESVESGNRIGRYSFMGISPVFEVKTNQSGTVVNPLESWFQLSVSGSDPVSQLQSVVSAFETESVPGLPGFTSGLVGYFAYESIGLTEPKIQFNNPSDYPCDLVHLLAFDTLIIFDNVTRRVHLVSNQWSGEGVEIPVEKRDESAVRDRLLNLKNLLLDLRPRFPAKSIPTAPEFKSDPKVFKSGVERAKAHIREGDIFQLVLSRRLYSTYTGDSFELFRALRVINPSPYLFFLDMGDGLTAVGSSPEVMVRVGQGEVEVRPIAGTRRRGKTEEDDAAIEQELMTDEKELAEHLMLIDLGRNDVGRVSVPGSVKVPDQMVIERYSHVMHIVSGVKGKLKDGLGTVDAFFSCFPAGTLTGAPKIRAMEIIENLEPVRRGLYGGAIGYLDFNGGMDTCIAIRTMVRSGDDLYLQAGAGIVSDSTAEREFQETTEKLEANLTGLNIVRDLLP